MRAIDDILDRLGLDRSALTSGDLEVRTPITGETLAHVARTDAAGTDAAIARATTAFEHWRDVPAPRRGELARLLGEELRSEEGALGALVTLETGKIAPGGPRRGAGDDRHLRLRRRSLAPALRADDRVGAPGPPHARDLAPARPRRRDQRLQLPGRRVELELGARARVRRSGRLEAVASARRSPRSPASRCCERAAAAFGDAPEGLLEVVIGGADAGAAAGGRPALPLVSATGSTRDGQGARAPRSPPVWAGRCSSSAATTR